MSTFLKYTLLFTVIISLQSCLAFKDLKFKGINNYKVGEFSLSGIKLNLSVKLENPNWFAIKAKGGEVHIKANEVSLGSFKIAKAVKIPKKSNGIVNIEIESKFKNILGSGVMSLISILSNGGKFKIEIDGFVKASALGISKKVKISTTEYIGL
jgi:LEA14-like dessication related protein